MKEHAIYKYVKDGEIVYIGKTDSSLESRIKSHRKEQKFIKMGNMSIQYFHLKNSTETDIYEKVLINRYQPVLNDVHRNEEYTDIKLTEPEWLPYKEKEVLEDDKKDKKSEVKRKKKKKKAYKVEQEWNRKDFFAVDAETSMIAFSNISKLCSIDTRSLPTDFDLEAEKEGTLDQYTIKWATARIKWKDITLKGLPASLKRDMWVIDQFVRFSDVRYPRGYNDGIHDICGYRELPEIFNDDDQQYEICAGPMTLLIEDFNTTIIVTFSTERKGNGMYFYIDIEKTPIDGPLYVIEMFGDNITTAIKMFGLLLYAKNKIEAENERAYVELCRDYEYSIDRCTTYYADDRLNAVKKEDRTLKLNA